MGEAEKDDLEIENESKKQFEVARLKLATSSPIKITSKAESKNKKKMMGNIDPKPSKADIEVFSKMRLGIDSSHC